VRLPLCSVPNAYLHEHKLNALPILPGLMIVDDGPLICEGLAATFGNSVEVHQAASRRTAAWVRVTNLTYRAQACT